MVTVTNHLFVTPNALLKDKREKTIVWVLCFGGGKSSSF
jgi:hypothetical protein